MDIFCCNRCLNWKPISDFYANKYRKRGYEVECKVCKKERDSKRYIRNLDNLSDEIKIQQAFMVKRLSLNHAGLKIITDRVVSYLQSIPNHKWEETVNKLIHYKYDESPHFVSTKRARIVHQKQ